MPVFTRSDKTDEYSAGLRRDAPAMTNQIKTAPASSNKPEEQGQRKRRDRATYNGQDEIKYSSPSIKRLPRLHVGVFMCVHSISRKHHVVILPAIR